MYEEGYGTDQGGQPPRKRKQDLVIDAPARARGPAVPEPEPPSAQQTPDTPPPAYEPPTEPETTFQEHAPPSSEPDGWGDDGQARSSGDDFDDWDRPAGKPPATSGDDWGDGAGGDDWGGAPPRGGGGDSWDDHSDERAPAGRPRSDYDTWDDQPDERGPPPGRAPKYDVWDEPGPSHGGGSGDFEVWDDGRGPPPPRGRDRYDEWDEPPRGRDDGAEWGPPPPRDGGGRRPPPPPRDHYDDRDGYGPQTPLSGTAIAGFWITGLSAIFAGLIVILILPVIGLPFIFTVDESTSIDTALGMFCFTRILDLLLGIICILCGVMTIRRRTNWDNNSRLILLIFCIILSIYAQIYETINLELSVNDEPISITFCFTTTIIFWVLLIISIVHKASVKKQYSKAQMYTDYIARHDKKRRQREKKRRNKRKNKGGHDDHVDWDGGGGHDRYRDDRGGRDDRWDDRGRRDDHWDDRGGRDRY